MRPFAVSRVILHLLQIGAWLVGIIGTCAGLADLRNGSGQSYGILPLLAAAAFHVLGVGVDALIELVQQSRADAAVLIESRDLLRRLADTQKKAFDRRNVA